MLLNKANNGDAEIAVRASWTAGHKYSHLEESVILAQEWLASIIGADAFKALDDFYNSSGYESNLTIEAKDNTEAVYTAQRALINYAYKLYAPKGAVYFDNTGISVKWSEQYRPANAELPAFLASMEETAFSFVSILIKRMDSNPLLYTEWASGTAKKKADQLLIRTAFEFSELYQIKDSAAFYYYTADKQSRVQRESVKPIVKTLWADLVKTSANAALFEEFETVETADLLPVEGSDSLYLVSGEKAFYQYAESAWSLFCADVLTLLPIAKQLIAEETIYLKTLSDISALPEISDKKKDTRIERLSALSQHQKAIADALKKQLSDAVALRDFVPTPEVETFVAPENPYEALSSHNSIML